MSLKYWVSVARLATVYFPAPKLVPTFQKALAKALEDPVPNGYPIVPKQSV